jgi:hypothetical protein
MNNPGVVVPPVPEKNTFGRFDDQFVRQRRFALEKCIHKIANHPVLGKDADLKLFLESDTFALDVCGLPRFLFMKVLIRFASDQAPQGGDCAGARGADGLDRAELCGPAILRDGRGVSCAGPECSVLTSM